MKSIYIRYNRVAHDATYRQDVNKDGRCFVSRNDVGEGAQYKHLNCVCRWSWDAASETFMINTSQVFDTSKSYEMRHNHDHTHSTYTAQI